MNRVEWMERRDRLTVPQFAVLHQLAAEPEGVSDGDLLSKQGRTALVELGFAFRTPDGRNHINFFGSCALLPLHRA